MGKNTDELQDKIYAALQSKDYDAAKKLIAELSRYNKAAAARLEVSLYIEMGDAVRAKACLEPLLKLVPDSVYLNFLAGRVLLLQEKYKSAIDLIEPFIKEGKNLGEFGEKIYNLLGRCANRLGDGKKSAAYYLKAADCAPSKELFALEYSNFLFNSHYNQPGSAREERAMAARYGEYFKDEPKFLHRRYRRKDKIRVGYISPDLCRHVVTCFSYALFSAYSKDKFEVYAYALNAEDEVSEKLKGKVDRWRNLAGLDAKTAARQIYDDDIDILFDFAGHTANNPLPILAYKPAPIIISGIGYFASTGLGTVDYFLGDRYLDGADGELTAEAFTEEMIVLPESHFCYTPLKVEEINPAPPFKRNGYITFGSFNNFAKLNDKVLSTWKLIMGRLPKSRLIIKTNIFNSEEGKLAARKKLRAAGLDIDRIECREATRDYLKEYNDVDIVLDSFPYPGGGTSADALFMGVPVVTLEGSTHGGRFGASLLNNLGLGELVAIDATDYAQKAVAVASDGELITALRSALRPLMEKSPLMNKENYVDLMENAYRATMEKYFAELVPLNQQEGMLMAEKMRNFQRSGDTRQALAAADALLSAKPSQPQILKQLIGVYLENHEPEPAAEAAALLTENSGYALTLKGYICYQNKDYENAEALAKKALALHDMQRGQKGLAHKLLADIYAWRGDKKAAAGEYLFAAENSELEKGKAADYSQYLYYLALSEEKEQKYIRAAHNFGELMKNLPQYRQTSRYPHKKIRVGYMSADFNAQGKSDFLLQFFQYSDRRLFSVYAYSLGETDGISRVFYNGADCWRDVRGLSSRDIAKVIKEDEIDVLVDLAGHTKENALAAVAMTPAPLVISGIGYFASTGLSKVDYFIADEHTAKHEEDRFFAEKLLRLANCCLAFDTPREELPPAAFLNGGNITFGFLGDYEKASDKNITAWAEILTNTPDAKLFLRSKLFADEKRLDIEKNRLKALGIDIEKVIFSGDVTKGKKDYAKVDIALDTFPFNDELATCQALYMGVPVVALKGRHHHGRLSYSVLENIGAVELVAKNSEEYVRIAAELAKDKEKLRQYHQTIRYKLESSPVMNTSLYMAEFEYCFIKALEQKFPRSGGAIKKLREKAQKAEERGEWEEYLVNIFPVAVTDKALPGEIAKTAFAYNVLGDDARALFWSEKALSAGAVEKEEMTYIRARSISRNFHIARGYREICAAIADGTIGENSDVWQSALLLRASLALDLRQKEARDYYKGAVKYFTAGEAASTYSGYLFAQNFFEVDENEFFAAHKEYEKIVRAKEFTKFPKRTGKIRVGYISGDFRRHVMFSLVQPFFVDYDKEKFEVYAYMNGTAHDEFTDKLMGFADKWQNTAGLTFSELANLLHEDELDILVDLSGHSAGNALPSIAKKPAPVIVSGLGYMATTGLSTVDYYWTDAFTSPEGSEKYFTEKLWRLRSQFCYCPWQKLPTSKGAPVKDKGYITFGILSRSIKYTDEMIAAWGEILKAVEGSKLLVKDQQYQDGEVELAMMKRFSRLGIEPERVIFENGDLEYMYRYLDIDIALDTYPYVGGGTAMDAIYMGVPFVTRYGTKPSTRFAYGILSQMGLSDLAAQSVEGYIKIAVNLAKDVEKLDEMHKNLRAQMEKSPLMDSEGYMQEIEAFYAKVTRR